MSIGDWTQWAACIGRPDLMEDTRLTAAALALCRRCPVLQQCRDWALSLPDRADPGGIAGGMTEEERSRLRSSPARRAVTEHGRPGGAR